MKKKTKLLTIIITWILAILLTIIVSGGWSSFTFGGYAGIAFIITIVIYAWPTTEQKIKG